MLRYDLRAANVDPTRWHHLAVTFTRSTRVLAIYLDGKFATSGKLPAANPKNALPLQIGRNGPVSGHYFQGKLDDIRIWRSARSATDIQSAMNQELTSAPAELVANWRFNDPPGQIATDSVGTQSATLSSGASFSPDVHP